MSDLCARCGRELQRMEAAIGEMPYCHPDDPTLTDCYTITIHETQNRVGSNRRRLRHALARFNRVLET